MCRMPIDEAEKDARKAPTSSRQPRRMSVPTCTVGTRPAPVREWDVPTTVVAHLSPRRPGFTGSHQFPTALSRPVSKTASRRNDRASRRGAWFSGHSPGRFNSRCRGWLLEPFPPAATSRVPYSEVRARSCAPATRQGRRGLRRSESIHPRLPESPRPCRARRSAVYTAPTGADVAAIVERIRKVSKKVDTPLPPNFAAGQGSAVQGGFPRVDRGERSLRLRLWA